MCVRNIIQIDCFYSLHLANNASDSFGFEFRCLENAYRRTERRAQRGKSGSEKGARATSVKRKA